MMHARRKMTTRAIVVLIVLVLAVAGSTTYMERKVESVMTTQFDYNSAGVIEGADAFIHRRGDVGCLLIHGFPGNPAEMVGLGQYLADRNITVHAIRLPGFGTSPTDLRKRRWHEWCVEAETGLKNMRDTCDKIFVVGFSTGGLLALYLASSNEVAGVGSLSTFIYPRNKLANLAQAPVLRTVVPVIVPYWKTSSALTPQQEQMPGRNDLSYPYVPLKAGLEILALSKVVAPILAGITEPVMIFQSKDDRIVDPKSASFIYENIGSAHKELIWLDHAGHVIVLSPDRTNIFECIHSFIATH